jgi:hypothetical protein
MRLAALVIAVFLLCVPVAGAVGTTTTPPPLVSSVPFLTGTATAPSAPATTSVATATTPAATATTPAVTATTPATTSTAASATPNGDLPYTGFNLLPETIAAVALILGGLLLRLRLAPRRGWRSRW